MNKYEITFITTEDQKDQPIKKEIESIGGKILDIQSLGQKQFSYKIAKETAGYYTTVLFEADPEKILELNKKLGLKTEVLRHLILTSVSTKIETPKPIKTERKEPKEEVTTIMEPETEITTPAETEIVAEPEEPVKPKAEKPVAKKKQPAKADKKTEEKTEAPKPVSETTKKLEEEAVSSEERLKALDKKLDELLKE